MKYLKDIERFVDKKVVFCGIDVHKHQWDLCFYCETEVLEKIRLVSSVESVLAHVQKVYSGAKQIRFVYEAGFSGFHLYRKLKSSGFNCMVTPATRIPKMVEKVKTDRRDAEKLARYHSSGLLRSVYVPPLSVESDRQILRLRNHYQKKLNRIKNQIKSHLNLYDKRWLRANGGYWSSKYVFWLETIEFEDMGLRYILDAYLSEYKYFQIQLKQLTMKILELSKKPAYEKAYNRLRSCKGVGLLTAMIYLLELYEIFRFSSGEQLGSYLGLTPSQYSSGDHIRYGHITREGNSHVRKALVESSWSVIRYDPFLRAKYDRIRAKGTNGKKAIVSVARSLAIRLRHCLLAEEFYESAVC